MVQVVALQAVASHRRKQATREYIHHKINTIKLLLYCIPENSSLGYRGNAPSGGHSQTQNGSTNKPKVAPSLLHMLVGVSTCVHS